MPDNIDLNSRFERMVTRHEFYIKEMKELMEEMYQVDSELVQFIQNEWTKRFPGSTLNMHQPRKLERVKIFYSGNFTSGVNTEDWKPKIYISGVNASHALTNHMWTTMVLIENDSEDEDESQNFGYKHVQSEFAEGTEITVTQFLSFIEEMKQMLTVPFYVYIEEVVN